MDNLFLLFFMKEKLKNKIPVQKFSVVFLLPVYPSKIFTAFKKLINPKLKFTVFPSLSVLMKKIYSILLKVYHIPTKEESLKATVTTAIQCLKPPIITDRIIQPLSHLIYKHSQNNRDQLLFNKPSLGLPTIPTKFNRPTSGSNWSLNF